MKRIFKYEIPIINGFSLDLPEGAVCLSAQVQRDVPQLWALVDPAAPTEPRWFAVIGTGHDVYGDPGRHLGCSFQDVTS